MSITAHRPPAAGQTQPTSSGSDPGRPSKRPLAIGLFVAVAVIAVIVAVSNLGQRPAPVTTPTPMAASVPQAPQGPQLTDAIDVTTDLQRGGTHTYTLHAVPGSDTPGTMQVRLTVYNVTDHSSLVVASWHATAQGPSQQSQPIQLAATGDFSADSQPVTLAAGSWTLQVTVTINDPDVANGLKATFLIPLTA